MMRRLGRIAAALLIAVIAAAPAWAARRKSEPIISRITIRSSDVFDFDSSPSLDRFPYSWINFLHIRTKEVVIQRELLFKVGDRLDPFLIQETERNLRALDFIRAARIARFPQRDGTVALVVFVNDAWTTEPQLNAGGQNKISTKEFGFEEKNFLGLGKNVQLFYHQGVDSIDRRYAYTDPRLLGSRWRLRAEAINKTAGQNRNLTLERPYYSADTRWSSRFFREDDQQRIDEYENNQIVSRFEQNRVTDEVAGGVKVGGGRQFVNHAGLRYRLRKFDYSRTSETAPDRDIPVGRNEQTVFADLETTHNNFAEATHLERMTRVEDLNLGPIVQLSPGLSPRFLTGEANAVQFEGNYDQTFISPEGHVFEENYKYAGIDQLNHPANERATASLRYYRRSWENQTLVFHTRLEWGQDLDPDNMVTAGGDNGLRAYKTGGIVGTRGFVFNAEDRLFLLDELWSLFAVGAVVFYDAGYVWDQNHVIAFSDTRSDAGIGLRLGLTRSANEVVLRFDLSYRMQRDPAQQSSHWIFSFGSGQAF